MTCSLQALVSLDHLYCHDEADELGSGEPYLWTAFFKVDGESVVVDLVEDDRPDSSKTVIDLVLRGGCTLVGSPGSHGNLGDTDVDAGDTVPIPSEVGSLAFEMAPIAVTERARGVLDGRATLNGGAVGVVSVLMEENHVTDEAAEVGHAVLNDALVTGINEIIPTLSLVDLTVPPEAISDLTAKVSATVRSAIEAASHNPGAFFRPDLEIGAEVFYGTFGIKPWTDVEISKRFQRTAVDSQGNHSTQEDYSLLGEIIGVDPAQTDWVAVRRSRDPLFTAPPAAGAPTVGVDPLSGAHNILYRDTQGRLIELWRDAAGVTGAGNLTDVAHGPTAAGNPYSYLDTVVHQQIILFRGSDGHVHSFYSLDGGTGHDDISGAARSPNAAGDPVGTFNPATNTHHIAYRGTDGQLHVVYWIGADGSAQYEGPLRDSRGEAPLPAGDPSMYFDARGNNVVVYRGTDNHIHSIYWALDEAGHDALSQFAGTPTARGEPVASYIPEVDETQITYRGSDDHLYEIYGFGDAPAQGWDVTDATPGAPPSASDPAVYYISASNTKHIIYGSSDGHLHEISWIVNAGQPPAHVDLTVAGLARRAVDRPAAFSVYGGITTQHVIYRSTDNEIRELRSPGGLSGWRWCNECQGLYYTGLVAAPPCPAGGTHTPPTESGSVNYVLSFAEPSAPNRQAGWRWCNKCNGLFWGDGVASSHCTAGGTHTPPEQTGSSNFTLPVGEPSTPSRQSDWRWCSNCQGLFYGGGVGSSHCAAGGTHAPPEQSGSSSYTLSYI
jgi:hypothetical protein